MLCCGLRESVEIAFVSGTRAQVVRVTYRACLQRQRQLLATSPSSTSRAVVHIEADSSRQSPTPNFVSSPPPSAKHNCPAALKALEVLDIRGNAALFDATGSIITHPRRVPRNVHALGQLEKTGCIVLVDDEALRAPSCPCCK